MRTEGRTDLTKLIAAFRNFVKAPKNVGLFGLRRSNHASTPSKSRWLRTSFLKVGPDWQGCGIRTYLISSPSSSLSTISFANNCFLCKRKNVKYVCECLKALTIIKLAEMCIPIHRRKLAGGAAELM
jgi:hypothetical protein